MHIVLVTDFVKTPDNIDGGVAGVSKYLADELVKKDNIKITVIAPEYSRKESFCQDWDKIRIYRVGKTGILNFLPGRLYDLISGKRKIQSLLKKINPDIVHFHGGAFLAANCKFPYVLTIHGIMERDALWTDRKGFLRWFKWIILKVTEEYARCRVKNVILISNYTKQFLPIKNKLEKLWSIENPIADSFFNTEWNSEPGRIFCCGRVTKLKNILGMVKSFVTIAQKYHQAELRIAGSLSSQPEYVSKCQSLVKKEGLENRVSFLGNISVGEVISELSKANCLVIPSFQEVAPLAIEEAMAVGVPIVGSKVGGIEYMIKEGETGFLTDPYDEENIAEAVGQIISDNKLAASMSENAKKIARERFMASAVSDQTLEVYQEILSEQKTE